ncbi:MAG: hypothetical protein EZS28_006874 [Streblomastix strix]|uniref:Uncharacterized protein n=1 Tax=Streblomastix strix TaxID=222440 RepID=A0A5J4WR37_9EUKA|nr:MAG: hypothetical protein EZS28_006874 [Streblomastix strix]
MQYHLFNGIIMLTVNSVQTAIAKININGLDDPQADWTRTMVCGDAATEQLIDISQHIKLWIGYSTASGRFQQIAICKYKTKLWETSIYVREQAVISVNSLQDEFTKNSVSGSSLESIVRGRRHCEIFLDNPVSKFAATIGAFNYKILKEVIIAGVLDLIQLNPIFNSFPVFLVRFES